MYRLQIKYGDVWRWGIQDYGTIEAANMRAELLASSGIKARVKSLAELVKIN